MPFVLQEKEEEAGKENEPALMNGGEAEVAIILKAYHKAP